MNNQIIPFKTDKGEFLAVEVPDGSYNFSTSVDSEGKYLQFFIGEYDDGGDDLGGELKLTDDSSMKTGILGKATELTETPCADIVDLDDDENGFYIDYMIDGDSFNDSRASFTSLMQSIGCDMSKQYVILKQQ